MGAEIHRIQPEAIHAALQPEAHLFQHGVDYRRGAEVKVRLAGQEVMQIVLAAAGIPLPRAAAEYRLPVGGRRAVGFGVGPYVPVGFGVVAALAALFEPRVLVGGVGHHLIDRHFQPPRVGRFDQAVEVFQRAEHGVDIAVAADVVAEIFHRRGKKRRQPNRIDVQ